MSAILDALKRADRDRSLVPAPTLASMPGEAVGPRRRLLPWAMAGALMASGATGLWFWLDVPDRVGEALPAVGHAAAERVPASSGASSSEASPAPSLVEPGKRVVPPAPQEAPAAAASRAHAPDVTVSDIVIEQPGLVGPPEVESPVAARESPASSRPDPAPASTASRSNPSPSRLREAMAKMRLNGVVYSERPADRKVYIGGRGYFEGEIIDGGIRVEEILPDGAALAFQQERAFFRMAGRQW